MISTFLFSIMLISVFLQPLVGHIEWVIFHLLKHIQVLSFDLYFIWRPIYDILGLLRKGWVDFRCPFWFLVIIGSTCQCVPEQFILGYQKLLSISRANHWTSTFTNYPQNLPFKTNVWNMCYFLSFRTFGIYWIYLVKLKPWKVRKKLSFGGTKIPIHVASSVENDLDKYQYRQSATTVTMWFKPKITILYEKPYLDTIFVLTNLEEQKTHPRVARHVIRHWNTIALRNY